MNIPLINSNSKQDINTSLIAIRNAINELARVKESESVEDLQRQINIINQQIVNLQPVDTVASGNLHSVTSNAVAQKFINSGNFYNVQIPAYTSTVIGGEIKTVGTYTIPEDGIYAIDWLQYMINDTQGGTSLGLQIVNTATAEVIGQISMFIPITAWNNGFQCNCTRKLMKNNVLNFNVMSSNPFNSSSSVVKITRII